AAGVVAARATLGEAARERQVVEDEMAGGEFEVTGDVEEAERIGRCGASDRGAVAVDGQRLAGDNGQAVGPVPEVVRVLPQVRRGTEVDGRRLGTADGSAQAGDIATGERDRGCVLISAEVDALTGTEQAALVVGRDAGAGAASVDDCGTGGSD